MMRPVAAAVVLAACVAGGRAEGQDYRRVYAGDLISGYLPEGDRVQASGHLGLYQGVIEFKTDPISARAPLYIETTALPRDIAERIMRECDMAGRTVGGCSATVRGTVPPRGSRRFAPDANVIEGPYKLPGRP
jgi:hypothetical protein